MSAGKVLVVDDERPAVQAPAADETEQRGDERVSERLDHGVERRADGDRHG